MVVQKLKMAAKQIVPWGFPVLFPGGALIYKLTGSTPGLVYSGFRKYYCLTNGRLNDFLSRLLQLMHRTYHFPGARGVLGDLTPPQIKSIVEQIDRDGFYIFDKKLPGEACDRILQFALEQKCVPYTEQPESREPVLMDRTAPVATVYHYAERTILQSPDVCQLMTDFSILSVAQAYLRSKPVCDLVAMWWSTVFSKTPSSAGAQLYHFDMDRIKFLKFFIYITDVSSDQGPHCFVRRSHTRKPRALLTDQRISDDEIARFYQPDDIVEIRSPKGIIVAEDTRGFHKGKNLVSGDRLMLQLEFTNSLFGTGYNCLAPSPFLQSSILESYPHTFRRFLRRPREGSR